MKRRTSFLLLKMLGAVAFLGAAGLCHAETITHNVSGKTEYWHIDSPVVNSNAWRNYAGQIVLRYGDIVELSAGGCVQTGGHGLTWKRYVDPQGPNSDHLYHGVFSMPGIPVSNLKTWLHPIFSGSDIWEGQFTIGPSGGDQDTLWLVYQDDGYSDNGYYSHDNGTGDQCKNIGNAWVNLIVIHP